MKKNKYNLVCGMEVHVQLKTKSGMFCGCKNDPTHAPGPNTYTCPVCLGLPGALPVANKKAIEWTVKLGLALGCKINLFSKFDRKHYFYPDLPKGYQISQYDIPFCYEGKVETSQGPVRITRIHLEEDTGKLVHKTINGKKMSLVDFNRSGTPLAEIVTEPDIFSSDQAKEYGKKLRHLVRYLGISDADMEQGGMRLEANISLRKKGETKLPEYKVELKNINSFRFMEQAIEYEIKRQSELLDNNNTPTQETRGWDNKKQKTFSQRTKESAEDYRYFPDPDLPPLRLTKAWLKNIKKSIPELPDAVIAKWKKLYNIESRFSERLITTQEQTRYLETIWKEAEKLKAKPNKIASTTINGKFSINNKQSAKQVVQNFIDQNQIDLIDEAKLSTVIKSVIKSNQDAVTKYKSGKTQVLGFLIGNIMRELKVKADPNQIREALIKHLS